MLTSALFGLLVLCLPPSYATHSQVSENRERLILVQILYRHGDRSPVKGYPNDPVKESEWPQGFGQLTKEGMEQHYKLGQFLRDRYSSNGSFPIIGSNYSRYEVHVDSTDYDRTLMSADSNLAGLFPPAETFTVGLPWQPIPVHTRPLNTDHVLWTDGDCPKYADEYAKFFASDVVRKEEEANKSLYAFVKEKTGLPYVNISDIWQVYDAIFCQVQHGYDRPEWVNDTVYQQLEYLNSLQFLWQYNATPLLSRLRGGPLLGVMVENMKAKVNDSMDKRQKLFLYSAHDSTVAALMSALKVYNGISPPYTAAVMVELHANRTVQLWYRNDSTADPYQLVIPGCVSDCPFDDFVRLTTDAIPVDWETECQLGGDDSHTKKKDIVLLSVTAGLGVLSLTLIIVLVVQRKYYRSQAGPLYTLVNSSEA